MHRRPLLELLARYRSQGQLEPEERPALLQLIQFVEREPRCFSRSSLEGHVTGSAWLLEHSQARAMLTHHRKLGRWLQPGGHSDDNPNTLEVALREAEEESGIQGIMPVSTEIFDVDVHSIPARKQEPAHLHYDVRFVVVAPLGAVLVPSEESIELAWVDCSELDRYETDASVLRLARKWQRWAAAHSARVLSSAGTSISSG